MSVGLFCDFYVRSSDFGIMIGIKESGLVLDNCTFLDIANTDVTGNGANASATCGGSATLGAKYVDRVKVSNNLFPWPNEDLIKRDMCRSGERQSDWCSLDKTLSEYVQGL